MSDRAERRKRWPERWPLPVIIVIDGKEVQCSFKPGDPPGVSAPDPLKNLRISGYNKPELPEQFPVAVLLKSQAAAVAPRSE
jgi:hypothetical protein